MSRASLLRWVYDLLYRTRAPWDMGGPRPELVELVQSGQIGPCRAIDLGCGTGDNVIHLAQNGFEAVGVDFSPRAIAQAQEKARAAGIAPTLVAGDVTDLQGVEGPFDLVVDYGCLGCIIGMPARERYAETLLRLTRPGSQYILLNLASDPNVRFNFIPSTLQPDEVEQLFAQDFVIEGYAPAHQMGHFGLSIEFRRMRRK